MKQGFSRLAALAVILFAVVPASAEKLLPLEAYGRLPQVSILTISPSGQRLAFRAHIQGEDRIAVQDLATGEFVAVADASDVNPRRLRFSSDGHLMLITSSRFRSFQVRNSFENSTVHIFDLADKRIRRPLEQARGLYPYQSGLGRVVGRSEDGLTLYIPAHLESHNADRSVYGYYRVDLDKRRPRRVESGNSRTVDWFLNTDGSALVREDYDDRSNVHQLWRVDQDEPQLLFEDETDIPRTNPVGLLPGRQSLLVRVTPAGSDVDEYYAMNIASGEVGDKVFGNEAAPIDYVITDLNRIVLGVRYAGFLPSYRFLDEDLNQRVAQIQQRLQGMYSELVGWSEDFRRLVFFVRGAWSAGDYLVFDSAAGDPIPVGRSYPAISRDHIATVRIDEYSARDGLTIPALVTARDDVYEQGNAPLIVLPHGGPASHDEFGFDWMAQYFASRGYVVLQPQFRGSTGFGVRHELAGRGEWGGKMQTDLDDGVQYLVNAGVADPNRVGIVGASYGGYAALAAGAFSPQDYKVIVSLAGVTDLYEMLKVEARKRGSDNWVVSYWEDQMGSDRKGRESLQALSPAHHAEAFEAPVLLLHGKNDTVVPSDQSKRMERALKRAGKDVTYEVLKGEDHWLTQPETRVEALRLMADFVDKHL